MWPLWFNSISEFLNFNRNMKSSINSFNGMRNNISLSLFDEHCFSGSQSIDELHLKYEFQTVFTASFRRFVLFSGKNYLLSNNALCVFYCFLSTYSTQSNPIVYIFLQHRHFVFHADVRPHSLCWVVHVRAFPPP